MRGSRAISSDFMGGVVLDLRGTLDRETGPFLHGGAIDILFCMLRGDVSVDCRLFAKRGTHVERNP